MGEVVVFKENTGIVKVGDVAAKTGDRKYVGLSGENFMQEFVSDAEYELVGANPSLEVVDPVLQLVGV